MSLIQKLIRQLITAAIKIIFIFLLSEYTLMDSNTDTPIHTYINTYTMPDVLRLIMCFFSCINFETVRDNICINHINKS